MRFLIFLITMMMAVSAYASDITFTWEEMNDPCIDKFKLYYQEANNGVGVGEEWSIVGTKLNELTFNDDVLVPEKEYIFTVTAININGLESEKSTPLMYTRGALDVPENPKPECNPVAPVASISNGIMTITHADGSCNIGYKLYYGTWSKNIGMADSIAITALNLDPGDTEIKIAAYGATGTESDQVVIGTVNIPSPTIGENPKQSCSINITGPVSINIK